MGNSRNLANLGEFVVSDDNGNITISGTLTSSGAFSSLGIDDNATTTQLTITDTVATFVGNVTAQGGSVKVGVADTTSGVLNLYGGATGDEGGQVTLYTTADYDTTYDFFFIDVWQDTLRMGRQGNEDITLHASGRLGIGEPNPLAKLHVRSADSGIASLEPAADDFLVENSVNAGLTIASGITNVGSLIFGRSTLIGAGRIQYNHGANEMRFWTNDIQRVVIDSSGDVTFNGDIHLADNSRAYFGTGNKLYITHTGALGSIVNDLGSFYLTQAVNGGTILFDTHDGAGNNKTCMRMGGTISYVRLYYDSIEKFRTYTNGISVPTTSRMGFGDNQEFIYGSNVSSLISIYTSNVESARFDTTVVAGNTRFWIYDVDNGAIQRVTVGAANSGGTGYKVLRILN